MDITSTATAQVSAASDTGASTQTQKSAKSDSSFKDEMNKVTSKEDKKTEVKTETKAEEQDTQKASSEEKDVTAKNDINDTQNTVTKDSELQSDLSAATVLAGSIDMTKVQTANMAFSPETQALIDANLQLSEIVSDTKVPTKIDYSTIQMDMNDAKFFTDLVQNSDKTIQNVMTELAQSTEAEVQEVQKNVKVSATLMNALSEAVKNKQSFRIDFDKDISVIIKVDRDGSLTARFIPGDSAVEQYLKQNMSSLRQRFDEQELPYKELSYTGQQKRERKENQNNKENGHE